MVSGKINNQPIWSIALISKQDFLNRDRDFVAELVSEEARKTTESYSFILHEIIESKRYSKILIEGTKTALTNLLSVINNNLPYKVCYARYGK